MSKKLIEMIFSNESKEGRLLSKVIKLKLKTESIESSSL